VRVDGQVLVSTAPAALTAALAGLSLAYLPEDMVNAHLASGALARVLEIGAIPSRVITYTFQIAVSTARPSLFLLTPCATDLERIRSANGEVPRIAMRSLARCGLSSTLGAPSCLW
jgi:DNA-binding transcriptional LysR family regulator